MYTNKCLQQYAGTAAAVGYLWVVHSGPVFSNFFRTFDEREVQPAGACSSLPMLGSRIIYMYFEVCTVQPHIIPSPHTTYVLTADCCTVCNTQSRHEYVRQ